MAAICAVTLAGCNGDAEGDIGEAEQVVTEATNRLAAAYAGLAMDSPDAENLRSSTAGCADGQERVMRRVVVAIQSTDEPAVDAAAAIQSVWSQENTDLDPGGDGRGTGVALTTFATDDATGTAASLSETHALRQDGYSVALSLFVVADGGNGATVVIDAYSDCLPVEDSA